MSHDVFISYSNQDKAVADAACVALEAAGIRCWIAPRDITPGAEWGEAIVEAINHCHGLVLIFSAHANDSAQLRREVERAVSKGIPIIPLRIQDIAPARSLEYFMGTVHWLDALTPPLEAHLLRLVASVKALLHIDPAAPRIVSPPDAATVTPPRRRGPGAMALGLFVAVMVAGIGGWWWLGQRRPPPAAVSPAPVLAQPPAAAGPGVQVVDPALVGTFTHDAVIDDYASHFVFSIAADGTYHLVITEAEDGTYSAGNGLYRTVGAGTGRVREGTYRAVGNSAVAVTGATGTAVFRPVPPGTPVDPAHPVMLGTWRATVVQGGLTWVLTLQNNRDGTYAFKGQAKDSGHCTFAASQWRTTSAVTGRSVMGTYQVLDAQDVDITGPEGPAVWHRQ